ncbi:MAG TPA: S8 family serine peptidase [Bacteroidales bacterium]|nr:S8 family serine peptidase [Bacteroidales bacterium]
MVNKPVKKIGYYLAVAFLILYFSSGHTSIAQEPDYRYFYRVYFTDKGDYKPENFSPSRLLSPKAIARRIKYGIKFPDYTDLPVYPPYINQIRSLGLTLHNTSKWMNTALFKSITPAPVSVIESLPFVEGVRVVKAPSAKSVKPDKLELIQGVNNEVPYDRQITMLEGNFLHDSGFDGTGVVIAVLDAGFSRANFLPCLDKLRARYGIRGTYDFVLNSKNVYSYHYHGTAVLSVLAGDVPGKIVGSAPGANYWLFRTEDVYSEFPVEEDYWAAAAEYADSLGADIISTSLGYYVFDDPSMNYKFEDLNGMNAFITRVADIAVSKGIIVVASAGNERDNEWLRIIAPSDGFKVICVGAVDQYCAISSFSSAGPSADGRIKPDNAAMGVDVTAQIDEKGYIKISGTSFSCPILSGMCACLLQAVPEASPSDIIDILHRCSDRANNPDSLYGFGIPSMKKAIQMLQEKIMLKPGIDITAGPNPFTDHIDIYFREPPYSPLSVEIYSSTGHLLYKKIITSRDYISKTLRLNDLQIRNQGIYFLKIMTDNGTSVMKVVKIND